VIDCYPSTIKKWIEDAIKSGTPGLKKRPGLAYPEKFKKKVMDEYVKRTDLSLQKVAEMNDVSYHTLERWLAAAGVLTRATRPAMYNTEAILADLKAGMIPVTFSYLDGEADVLWMKQLNPVFGETHPPEPVAELLGLEPEDIDADWPIQEVSTGVPFFMIPPIPV